MGAVRRGRTTHTRCSWLKREEALVRCVPPRCAVARRWRAHATAPMAPALEFLNSPRRGVPVFAAQDRRKRRRPAQGWSSSHAAVSPPPLDLGGPFRAVRQRTSTPSAIGGPVWGRMGCGATVRPSKCVPTATRPAARQGGRVTLFVDDDVANDSPPSWACARPDQIVWDAVPKSHAAEGGSVHRLAERLAATSLEDGMSFSMGLDGVAARGVPRSPDARVPQLPPLGAEARPHFLEPAPRMRPRTSPSSLSVTPPRGDGGGARSAQFSVGTARRGSRRGSRFSGGSLPRLGRRTPPRRGSPGGRGGQRATPPPGSRAEHLAADAVSSLGSASPASSLHFGGWTPHAPAASPSLPLHSDGAQGGAAATAGRPASAAQLMAVDGPWQCVPSVAGLPAVGVSSHSFTSSFASSPSARGTVPGMVASTDSLSPPDIPRADATAAGRCSRGAADARGGVHPVTHAAFAGAMAPGAASAVAPMAGVTGGTGSLWTRHHPTSAGTPPAIDVNAPWRAHPPRDGLCSDGAPHTPLPPRTPQPPPASAGSPSLWRRLRRRRGRRIAPVPPPATPPRNAVVARGLVEEAGESDGAEDVAIGASVHVRPAPSRERGMCLE